MGPKGRVIGVPINPDDPVDPLWNGGGDGLQNTGNLGDFRTALGRQICTAWRKQHLRGKDETVTFNSDPFLIAKDIAQTPKEL